MRTSFPSDMHELARWNITSGARPDIRMASDWKSARWHTSTNFLHRTMSASTKHLSTSTCSQLFVVMHTPRVALALCAMKNSGTAREGTPTPHVCNISIPVFCSQPLSIRLCRFTAGKENRTRSLGHLHVHHVGSIGPLPCAHVFVNVRGCCNENVVPQLLSPVEL
jgi:hypothetical protein